MKKTTVSDYKLLSDIEHCRARPSMYAGSTELATSQEWIYDPSVKKMLKREVSYIPAFVKIFSEILDNAIDEHRRAPELLDSIRVEFTTAGEISISDNGRGIPVELHPQTGKYIAETVFSNLRAGSNFNDEEDQQLIGTNGVGSTLTNIFSKHFRVESCDGKKMFRQDFFDGLTRRSEAVISTHSKAHTKITFTPDYEFFKLDGLSTDHTLKMTKKLADAAACNPKVKFYVNGERIEVKNFGDYIALYADEYVFDDTEDWKVGVSTADSFEQISFVNSVETYQGGSHVWYVMDQITEALREYLKKKYKTEVKPADIRSHMRVYISANINRPKFSSQTKENMISLPGTYKTAWTVPDAMIKKLIKSTIIQSVLDWVEAKAKMNELAELRKLNKDAAKANPKRVDKFDDAVEKKDRHLCECYFTEGDCLQENTLVMALTNDGQQNIKIRDLVVGDLVLTHKNRFKPVLATSKSCKPGVTVHYDGKMVEMSEDHRMLVYDRELKQFGFITAGELDKSKHQLVENQLVAQRVTLDDVLHIGNIEGAPELKFTTMANEWSVTHQHKFMIYRQEVAEFLTVYAVNIQVGDAIVMLRSK